MSDLASTIDMACALVVPAGALGLAIAYGARTRSRGAAQFDRVDQMGGSALVGKGAMQAVYWSLQPLGRGLVRAGATANAITAASCALGAFAGMALGAGMFGVAGLLSAASSLLDAVDGLVARLSHTASDAGEVFDATVDRYVELFFLAGAAWYFRASPQGLLLSLGALVGAFMVSYSTAKAEALGVDPPRGAMRRTERAVYLTAGTLLVPMWGALATYLPLSATSAWVAELPLTLALAVVAVVGNVSAIRRMMAIAVAVRRPAVTLEMPARTPSATSLACTPPHADAAHATTGCVAR